jgi:predicted ATPase
MSHGESFVRLFQQRFVPDGLYLLDEPEAPLSPMRQLALLGLLKHAVEEQGAQCLIATHSPILMALPQATIYSFDEGTVQPIAYEDTEHVRLTRDFLTHPEQFLRHL